MKTRALLIRSGSLGDTVALVPALCILRQNYDEVDLLVPTSSARTEVSVGQLSKILNLVDRVFQYDIRNRSSLNQLLRLREEVGQGYRSIYNLLPERTVIQWVMDAIFFKLLAPSSHYITSPPYKWHASSSKPYKTPAEPEWKRMCELVGARDESYLTLVENFRAKFPPHRSSVATGSKLFVAPGSAMPAKIWPEQNFINLCKSVLSTSHEVKIELIGSPDEREVCERVIKGVADDRVRNFAGKYSIMELFRLARPGTVFVGNDSGLLHLFSLMGSKTVGIFSARDSRGKWTPFGDFVTLRSSVSCHGCMLVECPYNNLCMNEVGLNEVLKAVTNALHE